MVAFLFYEQHSKVFILLGYGRQKIVIVRLSLYNIIMIVKTFLFWAFSPHAVCLAWPETTTDTGQCWVNAG